LIGFFAGEMFHRISAFPLSDEARRAENIAKLPEVVRKA
jgi:hypothetical protein